MSTPRACACRCFIVITAGYASIHRATCACAPPFARRTTTIARRSCTTLARMSRVACARNPSGHRQNMTAAEILPPVVVEADASVYAHV